MLTYDEVDALAAFAEAFGVTFPLLSDPDSEIIERFGILNTLIDPADHPWYGIPFPGAYVVGADGIVTAKYFEANLALRASADTLLRAALGDAEEFSPAPSEPVAAVSVDVSFDGDVLPVGVLRDLVVTVRVPPGQHVYGDPVPEGMAATSVTLDDHPGLIAQPVQAPATRPHTLAGTGETLQVYEGDLVLRVPITHNQQGLDERADGRYLVVTGEVRWQACDDDVCHLPGRQRFQVDVPTRRVNFPVASDGSGVNGMDFAAHFQAMIARRS